MEHLGIFLGVPGRDAGGYRSCGGVPMTPAEFFRGQRILGYSNAKLAEVMGCTERNLRYISTKQKVPRTLACSMKVLICVAILEKRMKRTPDKQIKPYDTKLVEAGIPAPILKT